jgi:uncharacterized protein
MSKRTIRVRGSAKVSGAPDWVTISFDVESRNYDYAKCMEQLACQTDSLREELLAVGLERESLKTTRFNIHTNFEWINKRNLFQGYIASHNLRVEFPFNQEYLNQVLRVLSRTQSQASFRISFEIKDPEPLRQQAIAEAVKNCRAKAIVLAEAAGVKLDELMQIDYSWSEVRFESRMEICSEVDLCEAAPAFDITPEDVDISDSVTVIWEIK